MYVHEHYCEFIVEYLDMGRLCWIEFFEGVYVVPLFGEGVLCVLFRVGYFYSFVMMCVDGSVLSVVFFVDGTFVVVIFDPVMGEWFGCWLFEVNECVLCKESFVDCRYVFVYCCCEGWVFFGEGQFVVMLIFDDVCLVDFFDGEMCVVGVFGSVELVVIGFDVDLGDLCILFEGCVMMFDQYGD